MYVSTLLNPQCLNIPQCFDGSEEFADAHVLVDAAGDAELHGVAFDVFGDLRFPD